MEVLRRKRSTAPCKRLLPEDILKAVTVCSCYSVSLRNSTTASVRGLLSFYCGKRLGRRKLGLSNEDKGARANCNSLQSKKHQLHAASSSGHQAQCQNHCPYYHHFLQFAHNVVETSFPEPLRSVTSPPPLLNPQTRRSHPSRPFPKPSKTPPRNE